MYLTQSLHHAVQWAPDRPVTVFGDRVRTARESAERVARLAGGLRGLGVGAGERVAILSPNSDRYHELLYAVWWLGAVAIPVNTRWSVKEIGYSLQDSGATALALDASFAAMLPDLREKCPTLRTVVHCAESGSTPQDTVDYEELATSASPVGDCRAGGETLALLLYTGGTTGVPKGVMVSHRNMMTNSMGSQVATGGSVRGGVNLITAPLFHTGGLSGWNRQNLVGGTHVFLPSFTPTAFLEAVARHQVTTVALIPTMIQMVCDHPESTKFDLGCVRSLSYGGSAISEAVMNRALDVFPHARLSQAFGMTETGVITNLLHEAHLAGGARMRSAGQAAPHADVKIVDAAGAAQPPGTVGEIVTRGDHVMPGYWNKPVETGQALRDGWMHTGDAGYLDEGGFLYVVDRIKDMIISGGENVYSAEVENALATHPAVALCAVIGVDDDTWGQRVHAVVTLRPGATATDDELRAHTKSLIAGYKAPRTVEIAESLPLSSAGKILKRELRARGDQ
ncbi:long-chain fatty acid--CoA ligase [Streptomyces sp. NPDC048527]|uniref:acyl-CoA synthetase n=1 Tax=Streptomyces sp. NPDC048527 TaxID=3365568 RepID=UPI003720A212